MTPAATALAASGPALPASRIAIGTRGRPRDRLAPAGDNAALARRLTGTPISRTPGRHAAITACPRPKSVIDLIRKRRPATDVGDPTEPGHRTAGRSGCAGVLPGGGEYRPVARRPGDRRGALGEKEICSLYIDLITRAGHEV